MCATMIGSRGCRSSSRCIDPGPVKSLPTGPDPAWTRIGTSASDSNPHTSSSSGSSRWNSPTCRCSLNSSTPASTSSATYAVDAVLGIERARPEHLGYVGRERARPVVEVRRDAGLVRVGERREPADAHRPQQLHPLLVRLPVADRPLAADLRAGGVEHLPHRLLDVRRQEVHVHVEEAGQPEPLPERADRCDVLGPVRSVSHPCPSAGAPRPARSPGWPAARRASAACPRSSCPGPARSRPWPGR